MSYEINVSSIEKIIGERYQTVEHWANEMRMGE
jgi:hypothetical protein